MMRIIRVLFYFFVAISILNVNIKSVYGKSLIIVNTSRPISFIANEVLKGVCDSRIITQPYEIVFHDYQFKPSDYKMLKSSDVIFAISKDLEVFLNESFKDKDVVYMIDYIDAKGVRSFKNVIDNDVRNNDDIMDENKKLELKLELLELGEELKEVINEVEEKVIHTHGNVDSHIWLSVKNAKSIADAVCAKMVVLDEENKEKYISNTHNFHKKLDRFLEENKIYINKFQNMKYIVMHDSYQYFEDNFNIDAPSGCLIDSAHSFVGTKTFMSYINGIKNKQYSCIIADNMLSESTEIFRTFGKDFIIEYVDIVGTNNMTQDGDGYLLILNNILQAFIKCSNISSNVKI